MVDIIVQGDFAAVSQGLVLPTDNAMLFARFGGTLEAGLVNYADEGAPLTEVGDVTVTAGYITADSAGNRLSSPLHEAETMTIIAVARAPIATGASRIVSSNPGSDSGVTFYLTQTTIVMAATYADAPTTLVSASVGIGTNDDWSLFVGEVEAGVGLRVRDEHDNVSGATAKTTARAMNTTTTLQIGGRPNSTNSGSEVDIAAVAVIPAILSAEERAAWLTFMRAQAARRGIIV
ncbi:hypothetical protein [Sphingobium sp.]|uniref:hypothetical protein n=1 Tax=Sphingobium sp. TaxID=1912891 RepID=UPI000DB7976F|nr:hypothetical protein [Sphingobium sp.]PZU67509.1 MAG: hypothetical protein DI540_10425 [Sphingobium sp.]